MRQFFGKYRGTVANNFDPTMLGRIQVSVPTVLGEGQMSWAMPCTPFAGSSVGLLVVPPIGANVWVEFENGDPARAIWTGGFWSQGELPGTHTSAESMKVVLKTTSATITLSELPGSDPLTLETTSGFKVKITPTGIEITTGGGKITLQGPKVSVNDGALEVT